MQISRSTLLHLPTCWLCLAVMIFMTTMILLWGHTAHSAVLIKDKLWQKGTVLNVLFLDGTPELQQLVIVTAPEWLQNTSLSFQFFGHSSKPPRQTHIRVSFSLHSGSQLGDHQDYASKYPTMNLFDLTSEQISDSGARRLILHEFGHALGFEHEYRSGFWPYGEKVIEEIIVDCYPKMQQIGYSRLAAIERCKNINAPIAASVAHLTAYDELSIMNYQMSFVDSDGRKKQIKPAVNLSLLDRYAMQRWYVR